LIDMEQSGGATVAVEVRVAASHCCSRVLAMQWRYVDSATSSPERHQYARVHAM
jgi:hypothetical protein